MAKIDYYHKNQVICLRFRGPSDYFADASLFKNFDITERVKAQFQFQAFNVFNHVPLGVPNASNARL